MTEPTMISEISVMGSVWTNDAWRMWSKSSRVFVACKENIPKSQGHPHKVYARKVNHAIVKLNRIYRSITYFGTEQDRKQKPQVLYVKTPRTNEPT